MTLCKEREQKKEEGGGEEGEEEGESLGNCKPNNSDSSPRARNIQVPTS